MMQHPTRFGLAALALLATASALASNPTAPTTNTLTVRVEGVRSDKGQLRAQLLARKDPDAVAETVGYAVEPARIGQVILTFRNLPAGEYAVQLFHDENDNGRVEMNLAGIPTEGFGFSNIAQVQGSIPPFDKMKVNVTGGTTAVAVLAYAP